MENIISPLTRSTDISLIRSINVKLIVKYYKLFHIDVSKYFVNINTIKLYKCNETGYQFYYPYNISGNSSFYEHFQKFDWYYMPWKWEHEVALKYVQPNSKIIEVGCVHGTFIKKINDLIPIKKCIGLELNNTAISKGINWEIVNEDVNEFSQKNKNIFDLSASFEVLEHIANPYEFIQSQLTLLKKGGTLIIAVPNNESFLKNMDLCLNMPPHHMGLWDEKSLKSLTNIFPLKLVNIHFENLKEYHVATHLNSIYYQNNNNLYVRIKRKIHKITGIYSKRFRELDLNKDNILGHTVLAVFEKL